MSNFVRVPEADWKNVCDAVRAKTGGTEPLKSGEVAGAIEAIEAGGGGGVTSAKQNDVTFIDYDGTVLYSYSLEEAQSLTELPTLPSHDGLVCQGWNYDLETIKRYDCPVTIGAMYITDDGKTRIHIHLEYGRTSPMLGCCPNGTVTVDWGDGTEPDILTGTSTTTVRWTPTHNYAEPGDYVIALTVDGEMGFYGLYGSSGSPQFSSILRYTSGGDNRNRVYQNAVQNVEIGDSVTAIGNYAFSNCKSLTSITIPNSVTSIGSNAFSTCASLVSMVIPDGVISISDTVFNSCYSLTSITIPESVTSIGNSDFYYCDSLASITIPNSVTSIGSNAFYYCYSIAIITIPEGVTSIDNYAFYNCCGVRYYDFTACTSVPTLSSTYAFSGISADCQMLIPAALYDEWSTATNWATYAKYMVAV